VSAAKTTGLLAAGLALVGLGYALGSTALFDSAAPVAVPESTPAAAGAGPVLHPAAQVLAAANPRDSLVYFPFNSLTNTSPDGIAAAQLLLRYLDAGEREALEHALDRYRALHSVENFGGEYTTLQWFCEYELADDAGRAQLLQDDDGRRFVELFGSDDWAPFREYLRGKYGMAPAEPDQLRYLDEIVRFNSPYRAEWEKTDRVMELLDLQPGMEVADVGSGAGYFAFRLADRVGADGRVYAVEMNPLHIDYMRFVASVEDISSLSVVPTDGGFPALPDGSLDRVFMCSAYQAIYISFREAERSAWIEDMVRALKPGGLVVVSENEPAVGPAVVPYRGISVSQPLIQSQLLSYGLELVSAEQLVPQRYLLVLRKPLESAE
jgi:ubiquinone/menaquinone biosynthesis C-methylase UbiE